MSFISIGLNARIITDFMSTNPLFQMGATLKFNFGLYKSFNSRDKEEIRAQVIKFKEGKWNTRLFKIAARLNDHALLSFSVTTQQFCIK